MASTRNLRKLARNQPCRLRYPGVCNFDDSTTVAAHPPFGNLSGMGGKCIDETCIHACNNCHDLLDSRVKRPAWLTEADVWKGAYRGLCETLQYLKGQGWL